MDGFSYDQEEDLKNSLDPLDTCLPELDNPSFYNFDFDCIKDLCDFSSDFFMDPIQESNFETGLGDLIQEEMSKVSLEGGFDDTSPVVLAQSDELARDAKSDEIARDVKFDEMAPDAKIDEIARDVESEEMSRVVEIDEMARDVKIDEIALDVKSDEITIVEITGGLDGKEDGVKCGDTLVGGENGAKSEDDESESSESESESESESGSSSDSSSSSSSSSDDDTDDDEEERKKGNEVKEVEKETDVEEGEIRDMVAWSDEDEEGGSLKAGPVLSKNEVLPPVPEVNVTLEPHHQTLPVGFVLSIVGAQVIVEGAEKHNPLNEGSILWITDTRSPLGLVDEIFGPVKNPYYIVRYNSESEVPSGIQLGTLISFVPEYVNHVLNNNTNLYKKGYDGENDEELSDEMEFSDDEKEAEYKRMLKISKRGTNDENAGNRKKNRNRNKNNNQPSVPPRENNQRFNPPVKASQNLGNGSMSGPSGPVQGFNGGPGPGPGSNLVPNLGQTQGFTGGPGPTYAPQLAQGPGFPGPSNGVWPNGVPFQQPPNMGFPMQNHSQQFYQVPFQNNQFYQVPFQNGMPMQQQFGSGPNMPPFNFVPVGGGGPGFGPSWPAFNQSQGGMNQSGVNQSQAGLQPYHVNPNGFNQPQVQSGFNQTVTGMGMQAPYAATASMNNQSGLNQPNAGMMFQGGNGTPVSANVGDNGLPSPQASQSNSEASQNFNRGGAAQSGRGRRGGFRRGGGGRSGRGRGRHQSN